MYLKHKTRPLPLLSCFNSLFLLISQSFLSARLSSLVFFSSAHFFNFFYPTKLLAPQSWVFIELPLIAITPNIHYLNFNYALCLAAKYRDLGTKWLCLGSKFRNLFPKFRLTINNSHFIYTSHNCEYEIIKSLYKIIK